MHIDIRIRNLHDLLAFMAAIGQVMCGKDMDDEKVQALIAKLQASAEPLQDAIDAQAHP